MKYKAEVVAYESYGEVYLGDFEVEADNEEEADMAARRAAKKRLFANSVEKNIRPKD